MYEYLYAIVKSCNIKHALSVNVSSALSIDYKIVEFEIPFCQLRSLRVGARIHKEWYKFSYATG